MQRFFTKIKHVRAEQWTAILCIVFFTLFQQTINPRKPFLGSVIGVKNNGNIIVFSNIMNVQCPTYSAGNVGLQIIIRHSFTSHKLRTPITKLNNDWRVYFSCRFQHSVNRIAVDHIDSRHCKTICFCIFIKCLKLFAIKHTRTILSH